MNSEWDGYWVAVPLKNHCPIKGHQVYTIINVCVFVNTIQKEMNIELDME